MSMTGILILQCLIKLSVDKKKNQSGIIEENGKVKHEHRRLSQASMGTQETVTPRVLDYMAPASTGPGAASAS
jgi:cell division protein ZapA (FtsZ GTPase activity inhibitor)